MQVSLNKKEELENKLDRREKKHEKEETIICTSTADRTGTSIDLQQNVVIMDQPVRVKEICHNNNEDEDQNEMLDKEDEVTILLCNYVYERRTKKIQTSNRVSQVSNPSKVGKGNRQVQAFHLFTELISRHEVHLEGQQRDIQISLPNFSLSGERVASKSSSRLKPKQKGQGWKSQALTGSSSRSVPGKRSRKSGIEEIEDGELDSRRWTYLQGKNEKSTSIFDHAPKQFDLVDAHIGYKESLLKFAQNLGPTAQAVASKKLNLLSLAQTTEHAFQAPVSHPSSARRLSHETKGKNVIMDRGIGRHSVSARDERPMSLFDRVGTVSAGRACITSFSDASKIQRSADVDHGAVREQVHCPTHTHSQSVLQQQQHQPPSNAAVTNAYTVPAGYQVPIAYEAGPRQDSYPSTTVRPSRLSTMFQTYPWATFRPSRLSTMCHASGSGYGAWGGLQSTQLNDLQRHDNPATLGQGFQQTSHDSHMQLQNQLGSEARKQQQIRLEQKPLPLLSNMSDAGTSHAGNFSAVQNHPTISNAAWNGQRLPLAQRSYPNLELQLRTRPLSP